jgi:hypothetical protein
MTEIEAQHDGLLILAGVLFVFRAEVDRAAEKRGHGVIVSSTAPKKQRNFGG